MAVRHPATPCTERPMPTLMFLAARKNDAGTEQGLARCGFLTRMRSQGACDSGLRAEAFRSHDLRKIRIIDCERDSTLASVG
jgi:hypothetical protein